MTHATHIDNMELGVRFSHRIGDKTRFSHRFAAVNYTFHEYETAEICIIGVYLKTKKNQKKKKQQQIKA